MPRFAIDTDGTAHLLKEDEPLTDDEEVEVLCGETFVPERAASQLTYLEEVTIYNDDEEPCDDCFHIAKNED